MPGRVAGQESGREPTKQNSTHFIPLWKIGAVIYYKFNLACVYVCACDVRRRQTMVILKLASLDKASNI